MKNELFVRKTVARDREALINLGHKENFVDVFLPDFKDQITNRANGCYKQCYVALLDNQILGSLYCMQPIYKEKILLCGYLAISTAFRRKGIATYLSEKCIEIHRQKGFSKIYSYIDSDNIPSLMLYKKLGYRIFNHFLALENYENSKLIDNQDISGLNIKWLEAEVLSKDMIDNMFSIYQRSIGEDYVNFFNPEILRENFITFRKSPLQKSYYLIKKHFLGKSRAKVAFIEKYNDCMGYCLKRDDFLKFFFDPEYMQNDFSQNLIKIVKHISSQDYSETIRIYGLRDLGIISNLGGTAQYTLGKELG